jgi:hypothetical protein
MRAAETSTFFLKRAYGQSGGPLEPVELFLCRDHPPPLSPSLSSQPRGRPRPPSHSSPHSRPCHPIWSPPMWRCGCQHGCPPSWQGRWDVLAHWWTSKAWPFIKRWAWVLVVAGLIGVGFWLPTTTRFKSILTWINNLHPALMILAFVSIQTLLTVLFLPGALFVLFAGFSQGFWLGTLLAWTGSVLGAIGAFLLGRQGTTIEKEQGRKVLMFVFPPPPALGRHVHTPGPFSRSSVTLSETSNRKTCRTRACASNETSHC